MPENNWLLNDSAPVTLAQEFVAAPAEWTGTYWGPAELAFNAAGGGGGPVHNFLEIALTSIWTAAVTRQVGYHEAIALSSSWTPTLVRKDVGKGIALNSLFSVGIQKAITKRIALASVFAVSVAESVGFFRTINVTSIWAVTVSAIFTAGGSAAEGLSRRFWAFWRLLGRLP